MERKTEFLRTCIALALNAAAATGCMEWEYGKTEDFSTSGPGLFIVNEGNFQYGNASLSYYDPTSRTVENEVFFRSNGFKLGDVAQSMTLFGGKGWIVVNNSHVIFSIDLTTFRETGRIVNLPSPRYIHFISPTKAYVTQLWDNRILIVNPSTYTVTGSILCPDMSVESGSTEQMAQLGKYVYVCCWSYQNRILKIDTESDSVVDEMTVGIQPRAIAIDRNGKLWAMTDGGYAGSPYGHEPPALFRIDPESMTTELAFTFSPDDSPVEMTLNGDGSRLYWINNDIWSMEIDAVQLPSSPIVHSQRTKYFGLTVNPDNGDIYVADAIDYQQQGIVYRFTPDGTLLDQFYTGINPGAFCWK